MRTDIRFVYITHDLHFALSRRNPTILMVGEGQTIEKIDIADIPASLVEAVLGAATLTTNAQRVIFFEGVSGKGLAHKLFKAWITGAKSAALGMGGRQEVIDVGRAFADAGIIKNAEVISFVDRDHGPEDWLNSLKPPAHVLSLHEIESVFALPSVLRAVASHVGYKGADPWSGFLGRARVELDRQMTKAVTDRVRARICHMLTVDMFSKDQVKASIEETLRAHIDVITRASWNTQLPQMFGDEERRIRESMMKDDHSILVMYSGKQALNDAAYVLGMDRERYADIVIDAIKDPSHPLNGRISAELSKYLPARE